jgi:hypothetical protein
MQCSDAHEFVSALIDGKFAAELKERAVAHVAGWPESCWHNRIEVHRRETQTTGTLFTRARSDHGLMLAGARYHSGSRD